MTTNNILVNTNKTNQTIQLDCRRAFGGVAEDARAQLAGRVDPPSVAFHDQGNVYHLTCG